MLIGSGTAFTPTEEAELTDDELLDKVQSQTFKYFYDFAHPACGMARERNTSVLMTMELTWWRQFMEKLRIL